MQLVTFKTSYIIMKYDELIKTHQQNYKKEVEKLISALMNYKHFSWSEKIYNFFFKMDERVIDKSWVRILEKSLIEEYSFKQMKEFKIGLNGSYQECLFFDTFEYNINDLFWYQRSIKKLMNEKQGIIKSEFSVVQVDQDEIRRLRLHE